MKSSLTCDYDQQRDVEESYGVDIATFMSLKSLTCAKGIRWGLADRELITSSLRTGLHLIQQVAHMLEARKSDEDLLDDPEFAVLFSLPFFSHFLSCLSGLVKVVGLCSSAVDEGIQAAGEGGGGGRVCGCRCYPPFLSRCDAHFPRVPAPSVAAVELSDGRVDDQQAGVGFYRVEKVAGGHYRR